MSANYYGRDWVEVSRDTDRPDDRDIIASIHRPGQDKPSGTFLLTWRQGKDNDFTSAEIERLWQALGFVQGKATT